MKLLSITLVLIFFFSTLVFASSPMPPDKPMFCRVSGNVLEKGSEYDLTYYKINVVHAETLPESKYDCRILEGRNVAGRMLNWKEGKSSRSLNATIGNFSNFGSVRFENVTFSNQSIKNSSIHYFPNLKKDTYFPNTHCLIRGSFDLTGKTHGYGINDTIYEAKFKPEAVQYFYFDSECQKGIKKIYVDRTMSNYKNTKVDVYLDRQMWEEFPGTPYYVVFYSDIINLDEDYEFDLYFVEKPPIQEVEDLIPEEPVQEPPKEVAENPLFEQKESFWGRILNWLFSR